MKKISSLLIITVIILTGCSSDKVSYETACKDHTTQMAFVMPVATSYNEEAINETISGLQKYCHDYAIGLEFVESKNNEELVTNLENMSKYELVMALGDSFAKPIHQVATNNPETHYLLIDAKMLHSQTGEPAQLSNVTSILYAEEEIGYLAGYAAGKVTQTGQIGFIAGSQNLLREALFAGYAQGAKEANSNIEITYTYLNDNDFEEDLNNTLSSMTEKNVDVIFTTAGALGDAVVEEITNLKASGQHIWVIGHEDDHFKKGIHNFWSDSVVLTNAEKNHEAAIYAAVEQYFESGMNYDVVKFTLNDELAMHLSEVTPHLNQILKSELESIKQEIMNDQIKIHNQIEKIETNITLNEI